MKNHSGAGWLGGGVDGCRGGVTLATVLGGHLVSIEVTAGYLQQHTEIT